MTRFGEEPRRFFEEVYRGPAPWDIGAPQPALVDLLERYPPTSPVLDAGCGSGDLSLALAGMGCEVVGVDFVVEAIRQAREKQQHMAADAASRVTFIEGDALHPDSLGRTFGAVVDSGFYHLFGAKQGRDYLERIGNVLAPGGRFYLLAFAVSFGDTNTPRAITEEELREVFAPTNGWTVLSLSAASFENQVAAVPAVAVCAERRTDG